jgi:hypothetical protein
VLNGAGIKEIEWHIKHYVGRGLMKYFKSAAELAKEIGVSPSVIEQTFKSYNETEKSNNDPFGKKYFQNMPWKANDEFAVAIVTPVVHYWYFYYSYYTSLCNYHRYILTCENSVL